MPLSPDYADSTSCTTKALPRLFQVLTEYFKVDIEDLVDYSTRPQLDDVRIAPGENGVGLFAQWLEDGEVVFYVAPNDWLKTE